MPSLKETLKDFDSRHILEEKLKALEDENRRLTNSLQEESRLRQTCMEEARKEMKRTEKMMDEKIEEIQRQAMESVKQVCGINKNLMVALCDRETCLRKMSGIAARLKDEQDKNRCRCKFASNVCQRLRDRNEELEQEVQRVLKEIEKTKDDNLRLKGDLDGYKNIINGLRLVGSAWILRRVNS